MRSSTLHEDLEQAIDGLIVNFIDGSSHLVASYPDMKIPISFALSWPKRFSNSVNFINYFRDSNFSFIKTAEKKFHSLKLKKLVRTSNYKKSTVIAVTAANRKT